MCGLLLATQQWNMKCYTLVRGDCVQSLSTRGGLPLPQLATAYTTQPARARPTPCHAGLLDQHTQLRHSTHRGRGHHTSHYTHYTALSLTLALGSAPDIDCWWS